MGVFAGGIRIGTPGDCAQLNCLVHATVRAWCVLRVVMRVRVGPGNSPMHGLSAVDKGWVSYLGPQRTSAADLNWFLLLVCFDACVYGWGN